MNWSTLGNEFMQYFINTSIASTVMAQCHLLSDVIFMPSRQNNNVILFYLSCWEATIQVIFINLSILKIRCELGRLLWRNEPYIESHNFVTSFAQMRNFEKVHELFQSFTPIKSHCSAGDTIAQQGDTSVILLEMRICWNFPGEKFMICS
jgi:hypothetical protein